MTDWFVADTHFGHKNIIRLAQRPFADVDEMDAALINSWNDRVGKREDVWFLGDFSFYGRVKTREILAQLNGQIHLVRGNHDQVLAKPGMTDSFTSVHDYKEIRVDGQKIVLMHFPLLEWADAHHGSWHLHGHTHNNLAPTTLPRVDVGVDGWGYAPVSFDEIRDAMAGREWVPVSHH